MEQPLFSWQGPQSIIGEVGYPREPGGLEAKAPLGLAVTTLLRGKQTPPSWREGDNAAALKAGREESVSRTPSFLPKYVGI